MAHPTPPRLPWAPLPSPPRRLLHVSSTLCDTHQGKLPGSSTTSPLLLINFLVWTNRIKQFYRSSRNIHYHAGERLFRDTFFPRGEVSLPARSSGHLWFRVAREETATVVKTAGSCWGQMPKLTEREDPQHLHGSGFDLGCGAQSSFKSTLPTPPRCTKKFRV